MLVGKEEKNVGEMPAVQLHEVNQAQVGPSLQRMYDKKWRYHPTEGGQWEFIVNRSMTPLYIDENYFYMERPMIIKDGYHTLSRYGGWIKYGYSDSKKKRKRE
jgi:hypothetical protein